MSLQRRQLPIRAMVAGLTVGAVVSLAACSGGGATPSPPTRSSAAATTTAPGASASPTAVDARFRATADAACAPYLDYNTKHPFTFDFDPHKPDKALLPQIGAFFDANPTNHTLGPALRALGAPRAGGTAWSALLGDIDRSNQWTTEQIAAAKAADTSRFSQTVTAIEQAAPALHTAFGAAGFGYEDSCTAVLGG